MEGYRLSFLVSCHNYILIKGITYLIRVKENIPSVNGYKTRHWCCQDKDRKQKSHPSEREGAKHRDTLGMHRYNCKSALNISCWTNTGNRRNTCTITIWVEHQMKHVPYYDVALPLGAVEMIQEDLEWTTPSEMARKIQVAYPAVSAKQVHKAWTTMSETLWKKDADQLLSARTLLQEYKNNVDILTLLAMDGIEQVVGNEKDYGPNEREDRRNWD
jgi:hypothetical protein